MAEVGSMDFLGVLMALGGWVHLRRERLETAGERSRG